MTSLTPIASVRSTSPSVVFEEKSERDCVSVHTLGSHSSSSSSMRVKQRLKVEAARAQLHFANQEAQLKRERAEMVFRQVSLDTDLEILEKERDCSSCG